MTNTSKQTLMHWSLPLLLALISVVMQVEGTERWRFERILIAGEPWRLLSGHLVHLGWIHLLLNLAGLVLIWALFGHLLHGWVWCIAIAVCALAVSGGLYLFDSGLAWYVGLSGVLHGLLVLGGVASLRRERRLGLLVLGVVATKLLWEQFTGNDSGTALLVGGTVIVNSHLYGALAGLLCAPLIPIGRYNR